MNQEGFILSELSQTSNIKIRQNNNNNNKERDSQI